MLGIFKYGDLSSKIRAMKGNMLTSDDYEQMMLKPNVKELALYLKDNTYYKESLEALDESDVHRGQLEVLLFRAVVKDALKIAKHLIGPDKKIYRYIYRKFETEDVKKMIRTLQMNGKLSEIDRSTLFVSHYSLIDFNKTLEAKNVEELIETLKDTYFYPILKPLIDENGEIDIFKAEMLLDLSYYQKMEKQVKKMPKGKGQNILRELFGLEIDFKNLFLIYRAKKHYNLSKEMIYRYIIPVQYKLTKELLNEMIETADIDKLLKLIGATFYGKIIDFSEERVELQFFTYMKKVQEHSMRFEPFTIAPMIGYMYLKEIEVQNITNIVEGIRYQVDPKKIHGFLAGVS